ncbi:MAG: ABC transporter permease [Bacteroidales bacterium]|nr:ABC transporter permease [Bacteroidales bacterium]
MNFPLYIAKRYLVSKKSHNVINIISGISVAGVTIGTMALIVVLSVFNGFESLVTDLFNSFDPDLKITVKEGKTFKADTLPEKTLKSLDGVKRYTKVVEENALLRYKNKQHIATIKGVSEEYEKLSGLDTMIVSGDLQLQKKDVNYAVLGYGVAYYLGLRLGDFANPVSVYVPRRTARGAPLNPASAFNTRIIHPSGIFSIQQDFDTKYVIVPLRFARDLLEYNNEVTSVEIGLYPGASLEQLQKEVKKLVGDSFEVKNRFQQQELLYKIMRSEKWAVFLILSFILLIATFNVIGSLSMLILDKRKDIGILRSMGASNKLIRQIFLVEGLMISLSGAILGLLLGALISWLQIEFGLVQLQAGATFIIDAYPVEMQLMDFVYVFITVFLIGIAAAWFPVRQISKKYLQA